MVDLTNEIISEFKMLFYRKHCFRRKVEDYLLILQLRNNIYPPVPYWKIGTILKTEASGTRTRWLHKDAEKLLQKAIQSLSIKKEIRNFNP